MNRHRFKSMRILGLWIVLGGVLLWPGLGYAEDARPIDAESIRQKLQRIIDYLDSPQYARLVSWNEHVVISYLLARERAPTALEFYLLSMLRDDIGFTRSAVLSVALRAEALYPGWIQCRNFVGRFSASDFRTSYQIKTSTRKLERTSRWKLISEAIKEAPKESAIPLTNGLPATPSAKREEYKIYFGYFHAHSELSLDAEGDPFEAYEKAHKEGELDYFALTDHGEYLIIWPWQNKWQQLVEAAKTAYMPGKYATLWGFEWSNPFLGHINILNTDDFTNTISTFGLFQVYDWLIDRPGGFGRFNHPGDYDYLFLEHYHFRLYPDAVPQMVGIENYNGNDGFDLYYYSGSWWSFIPYSYWDVGNLRRWYLGSLGGQDNHDQSWGIRNQFRTAVLATELTRESIVEAYLNRRFYATEDKNLHLDFRCQGHPMGSRLSGVSRKFEVSAWDDDPADKFQEVRLYRNGNLLEKKTVSGSNIHVSFEDTEAFGWKYYYVIVGQNDDNDGNGRNDEAISSPIWIK